MIRKAVSLLFILLILAGSAWGGAYDGYKLRAGESHWNTKINSFIDRLALDIAGLSTEMNSLSNTLNNWALTEDYLVFVTAIPTYSDADTFTLSGDYTAKFTASKVVLLDLGTDGIKTNTVASSSYGGGATTINLNTANLTNNLVRVWVVSTRDGLWPNAPGWVMGTDYGSPGQTALDAAITVIAGNSRELTISPGTWSVTSDTTIPANIALRAMPGAVFSIATTKTLTINGPLEAGPYQIFSWSGTGKAVLGPGSGRSVYAEWWGAVGDGAADDSTVIQAAIDCCSYNANLGGPATIKFLNRTYLCNLTLKDNVHLAGATPIMWLPAYPSEPYLNCPILKAAGAGAVVDTPAGDDCNNASIRNLGILGLGAGTACLGVHYRSGRGFIMEKVGIYDVALQAVLLDSASVPVLRDVIGWGLLDTSSAAKIGVLELGTTVLDGYFENCEFRSSIYETDAKISTDLYNCAVLVKGATNYFNRIVAEMCEVGWHLPADGSGNNIFTNCRGEFNMGHGWEILVGGNQLTSCRADRNSLDASDTYAGFYLGGTSRTNQLTGCKAYSITTNETHPPTVVRRHKYGFWDISQATSAIAGAERNTYVNCASENHVSGWFSTSGAAQTDSSSFPTFTYRGVSTVTNGTTIDVDQQTEIWLNYGAPATVTNLTKGVQGQVVTFYNYGSTITFDENSDIHNLASVDYDLTAGLVTKYRFLNSQWRQE